MSSIVVIVEKITAASESLATKILIVELKDASTLIFVIPLGGLFTDATSAIWYLSALKASY